MGKQPLLEYWLLGQFVCGQPITTGFPIFPSCCLLQFAYLSLFANIYFVVPWVWGVGMSCIWLRCCNSVHLLMCLLPLMCSSDVGLVMCFTNSSLVTPSLFLPPSLSLFFALFLPTWHSFGAPLHDGTLSFSPKSSTYSSLYLKRLIWTSKFGLGVFFFFFPFPPFFTYYRIIQIIFYLLRII